MLLKITTATLVFMCFYVGVESYTTAFPEICRVMALYRTCDDIDFRIACPQLCTNLTCASAGSMVYTPSTGLCIGGTKTHTSIWSLANEFCLVYGGKLFVSKNAADSQVVQAIVDANQSVQKDIHVGATNSGVDAMWVYIDGTLVTQSNWDNGYPTIDSSNNLCMHVRSDTSPTFQQRNDACNQNFGYVCEADPSV